MGQLTTRLRSVDLGNEEFTMRSIKPTPKFNTVFAAVLSLTLASGGAGLHLSAQPNLTEAQNRLLNSALAPGQWAPPP